jgi:3-oxoacyl-[acyl-carrier protein] reductase
MRCCDYKQTAATVAAVKEALGTVDILVNNAGITKDGMILNMKEEAFDAVMTPVKRGLQYESTCSPLFEKKRSGKIINIGSVSGLMGKRRPGNYSRPRQASSG